VRLEETNSQEKRESLAEGSVGLGGCTRATWPPGTVFRLQPGEFYCLDRTGAGEEGKVGEKTLVPRNTVWLSSQKRIKKGKNRRLTVDQHAGD